LTFLSCLLAALVVVMLTRSAAAHEDIRHSEYAGASPSSANRYSAGNNGCTQGCHTGGGAVPSASLTITGGASFSSGAWWVDPGGVVNFSLSVTGGENYKGMSAFNTTGNIGSFVGGSGSDALNDPSKTTPSAPFEDASFPVIQTGDYTFTFQWQAPGTACVTSGVAAWANSVNASDYHKNGTAYGGEYVIRTRCGNGTGCGSDGNECITRNCIDGVCCNTACGGTCDTCVGSSPGTCAPTFGPTRGRSCPGSAPCVSSCTGGDNCSPSTAACGGGTCNPATETALPTVYCSGGSCPSPTPIACAPFTCNSTNTACKNTCAVDGDCSSGNFCSGGTCVSQLPPGSPCTLKNQCLSGFCVDGVCCSTACTEQCGSCSLTGKAGTCSGVTGAPVGGRAVCATDGTVCGGACDGSTITACAYPTTSCRTADCTAGVATAAASCDGKGACPLATTTVCAPYACSGTGCGTTCTTDADCATGNWCQTGKCVPKSIVGASCGTAAECTSGNCIDFVCCDKPCSGSCEACDVAGRIGTCSTISGAPHGTRTCPADPTTGCPETCDGTSPSCATAPCDAGAEGGTDAGTDGAPADGAGGEPTDETAPDTGPPPFDVGGGIVDASGDGDLAQPNENGGCACRSAQGSSDAPFGAMAGVALGVAAMIVRRRRRG
jgi:MYXO-CTERM domain-containing protein